MTDEAEAPEATVALKVILVTVQRDLAHIPAEIFEHEIPILDLMHGEGMVKVVDDDYHELEIPADANIEYLRLQGKYDRSNVNYVSRIYRDADELGRKVGLQVARATGVKPSQADIVVRKPARKSAKKK